MSIAYYFDKVLIYADFTVRGRKNRRIERSILQICAQKHKKTSHF